MRFVRLRKGIDGYVSQIQALPHPVAVVRVLFNLVFWVFLLPFFTPMSYGLGFVLFSTLIAFRGLANLYANNVMPQEPAHYERFAFRQPM